MAFQRREDEKQYDEEPLDAPGEGLPAGDPKIRIVEKKTNQPGERKGTAELLASGGDEESSVSLVSPEEAVTLRARWKTIQTRFVDEPRGAVEEADTLVADVIRRVTELFADERAGLEKQWSRGDNISTEELRLAMQRYRSFFDRLLSQ